LEGGGGKVVAFVLLTVEVGREWEVRDAILERFKGSVSEAWVVFGMFDIVVKVEVDSLDELRRVVEGIRRVDGVVSKLLMRALPGEGFV